ncbi:hypothetical protein [Mesorhizobium sp. B2-6-4]|nr:hypothetical protein [Mesorhizobium sp. B2-6-4]
MTRKGTTKAVEKGFGDGRLEVAMSETGDIGNPAMSQIVNAAIAFMMP